MTSFVLVIPRATGCDCDDLVPLNTVTHSATAAC